MEDLRRTQRLRLESRMPKKRARPDSKCFLIALMIAVPFMIAVIFLILINRDIPTVRCRPLDFAVQSSQPSQTTSTSVYANVSSLSSVY